MKEKMQVGNLNLEEARIYSDMFMQYESKDEAVRALNAANALLRRMRSKLDIDAFCVLALSNTDGSHAKRTVVRGKRGRPTIRIIGKKVKWHIHVIVCGEKAPTLAKILRDKTNNNADQCVVKMKRCYNPGFFPYVLEQSEKIRIVDFGEHQNGKRVVRNYFNDSSFANELKQYRYSKSKAS